MGTGVKVGKCSLLTAALSALVLAVFSTAWAQGAETADATVPVKVNVAAKVALAPITGVTGTGATGSVQANAQQNFNIKLTSAFMYSPEDPNYTTGVSNRLSGRANAGASAKYSRGNVTLNLPPAQYQNAEISLYSINGKRILSAKTNASKTGTAAISRVNVPAGVYLLSAKGTNGNTFSTRLTHSGNGLNINAAFGGAAGPRNESAAVGDYGRWTITVSADGYFPETRTVEFDKGTNTLQEFTLKAPTATAKANFTQTVGSLSFDMIYIPGGTFTIGCTGSNCSSDTRPVEGVKVSNYFIAKTELKTNVYNAVMGKSGGGSSSIGSITWYDAMEFACKLSQLTGRNYRMTTEAEWEYAAKNRSTNGMSDVGGGTGMGGEEWAYNSWLSTHSGGTDPVGTSSGAYTQKTRRDASTGGDNVTARLIRSVEGIGPALRLALSADVDFPPNYVPPCNLHMPKMDDGKVVNSYRDPRWITGSDAVWDSGSIKIGNFNLRVWDDGTAILNRTNGQWFTSNNIAFVFVPSSGSITKFPYIFLDVSQAALISEKSFMSGGYIGRIEKRQASSVVKPTISGLKSGKELATAAGTEYKMIDMTNIPTSARQQDSRLLDGTSQGWFQNNTSAGGVHHYRKDVDADEFRFTVNQQPSSQTMLANGTWFTVNNTFLRVTHPNNGKPYVAEYLYAVTSDGKTFYHNSFMGYERGDFRMFEKTSNSSSFPCGSLCNGEIPKGKGASMYASQGETGASTYRPAPCPTGGCN